MKNENPIRVSNLLIGLFLISVCSCGQQSPDTASRPLLESISVIPHQASIHIGNVQQFKAVGRFSDHSSHDITAIVNWSSTSADIPIVSNTEGSKGLCFSPPEGSVSIVATEPNSRVSGKAILSLSESRLVSIEITSQNQPLVLGRQYQFRARGLYEDGTTNDMTQRVVWSVSDSTIVSISNEEGFNGLVTTRNIGSVTIKAIDPTLIVSGTTHATVTAPRLEELTIRPPFSQPLPGQTFRLSAIGRYTDGRSVMVTENVEWRSEDTTIARADNHHQRGSVTILRSGRTRILAVDPDTGLSAEFSMVIADPRLKTLRLVPRSASLHIGQGIVFQAIGVWSDGSERLISRDMQWVLSNADIAKLGELNGKDISVSGVSPGQVDITASHSISGMSAVARIKVEPAILVCITISPEKPSLPSGSHMNLSAMGSFSDNTIKTLTETLSWESSNPAVATVGDTKGTKGLIRSIAPGTAVIKAICAASKIHAETVLIIKPPILVSIEISPIDRKLYLGEKHQFTATGLFSDGVTKDISTEVSWSSSDKTIATVGDTIGDKGLATILSIGYCDIIATDPISGVFAQNRLSGRSRW